MNNDTKNLFLAIALSVMVLVGWQYFVGAPKLTQQRADQQAQQSLPPRPTSEGGAPAAPQPGGAAPTAPGAAAPAAVKSRADALAASREWMLEEPCNGFWHGRAGVEQYVAA